MAEPSLLTRTSWRAQLGAARPGKGREEAEVEERLREASPADKVVKEEICGSYPRPEVGSSPTGHVLLLLPYCQTESADPLPLVAFFTDGSPFPALCPHLPLTKLTLWLRRGVQQVRATVWQKLRCCVSPHRGGPATGADRTAELAVCTPSPQDLGREDWGISVGP